MIFVGSDDILPLLKSSNCYLGGMRINDECYADTSR
jgi:hypothetical protein